MKRSVTQVQPVSIPLECPSCHQVFTLKEAKFETIGQDDQVMRCPYCGEYL